jgi:two-component system, chemotaxis family, CheB/CheR fusion protein
MISVKDNGIGFEQQYADQIFLIFHRLNSVEEYAGTGIGLALCKKIVVNHQGEIYGISQNQDGALFQIILPATQVMPVAMPKHKGVQ